MALGSLCLLTVALACGGGSNGAAGDGAGGDDGSGNTGNTGAGDAPGAGGGGNTVAGEFDAIWRPAQTEVTFIDAAMPTPSQPEPFEIPARLPAPGAPDRELEVYQQIVGDQLVTYAYYVDDDAYYRLTQAAASADDAYVVLHNVTSRVFTIEEGVLASTVTESRGTSLMISQTSYEKYEGDFPPSSWPAEAVEVDVTALEGGE